MKIKGFIFKVRQEFITQKFGLRKWNHFIERISKNESFFNNNISPITIIPIEKFLYFEEELLNEFFNGDEKFYWLLGEDSAEYSFKQGPYQVYIKCKNIKKFLNDYLPILWNTYYSGRYIHVKVYKNIAHIYIKDIPYKHIRFEYTVMGFIQRTLKLMGFNKSILTKIKGFSSGDDWVHYKIEVLS